MMRIRIYDSYYKIFKFHNFTEASVNCIKPIITYILQNKCISRKNFSFNRSYAYHMICPHSKILKGPVKLIQRVKIAHPFLHVMHKLLHPVLFSLSR